MIVYLMLLGSSRPYPWFILEENERLTDDDDEGRLDDVDYFLFRGTYRTYSVKRNILESTLRIRRATCDRDVSHVTDASQSFTSESEGRNVGQIFVLLQLARRESFANDSHIIFLQQTFGTTLGAIVRVEKIRTSSEETDSRLSIHRSILCTGRLPGKQSKPGHWSHKNGPVFI